jgi:glycosyltransferase involved in cell wall biosynthesis
MNILEVVEACAAGVGRHVQGLCRGLVAAGQRVTVAYAPGRLDESFRQFMLEQRGKIRFVSLNLEREVSPVSDLRGVVRLMRLIAREGPFDIVHGHSAKGGAVARIAGRWFGLPTVYTPHGLVISTPGIPRGEAAVYTWIERFLGHWATSKVVAVSEDERQFILRHGLTSKERTALISNGIEGELFESFSRIEVSTEPVDSDHPLTFGALMRFSPEKNPVLLVEAFSRLNQELPKLPMQLVIAGDGELFDEVKRRVETGAVEGRISLPGWTTDITKMLQGFDVYVLSSLSEGGSYAVVEAMAAKLPIVSTDVFGTKETIGQVAGNVRVPRGDADALAAGMKRMATVADAIAVRQALQQTGLTNHNYASAHFSESETVRRTLGLYRTLR